MDYEIKEHIAVLSTRNGGWNLELNKVSWNGNEPKFDIRQWNEDHSRCSKGITLTEEELAKLAETLK